MNRAPFKLYRDRNTSGTPIFGICLVYVWYIHIIYHNVVKVSHDEAKLISKTLLACNLSRSKTQRQSRRLKYAPNKAAWLRISDWPQNHWYHNVLKVSMKMLPEMHVELMRFAQIERKSTIPVAF